VRYAFSALMLAACAAEGEVEASALDASTRRDASLAVDARRELDAGMEWPDARASDAASTPACRPASCASDAGDLPDELRCTGLYAGDGHDELACGVASYRPAFELWSDGALKRRFVALPAGTSVDVRDPDAFVFPVGTRFWKEFSVETAHGLRRAETRLLIKLADGWRYTSYVWSEDGQHAQRNDQGVRDWLGSGHEVPSHEQCRYCHQGRRDFVLGWDGVLMGEGAEGRELLPPELARLAIPGDERARRALGYLHVNCGVSCHHAPEGAGQPLALRLDSSALRDVASTPAVRTGANRAPGFLATLFSFGSGQRYYDLRPGDPERSLIVARMRAPSPPLRMPQVGSHELDPQGVEWVSAWIREMSTDAGYPAPAP
jgi:hypothetical protein